MKSLGRGILLAACVAAAQSSPKTSPANSEQSKAIASIASVTPLVKQQFGPTFTPTTSLPRTILSADFDGDGVEDVVIAADSDDPMPDSYDYKYQVSDPYNAFFGFGDPNHTSTMAHFDPGHTHDLLIIFGAGPEAWHSATPKAKFVLINIPFDTLALGRLLVKKNKPPIFVVKVQEARLMESNVFYDVKKKRWRWQPADTLE
jgi:hypothetical protein